MIVTIDGPAGAGKSTVAHGLAARLGYLFLDTGATCHHQKDEFGVTRGVRANRW